MLPLAHLLKLRYPYFVLLISSYCHFSTFHCLFVWSSRFIIEVLDAEALQRCNFLIEFGLKSTACGGSRFWWIKTYEFGSLC